VAAVFVIVTLILLGGGYWYYHDEYQKIHKSNYDNIASIAKMKVDQITQWRRERLANAKTRRQRTEL